VLTTLLLGTEERYYVRDLARRLALQPTAVSRELITLERLGLVRRETDGRRVYCSMNPVASVLGELRGLVLKLGGIAAGGTAEGSPARSPSSPARRPASA